MLATNSRPHVFLTKLRPGALATRLLMLEKCVTSYTFGIGTYDLTMTSAEPGKLVFLF